MSERKPATPVDMQRGERIARYLLWSAMMWLAVRVLLVCAMDQQTPFLSANDRSRWCTVRSLVEQHTYRIDDVIENRGWNTIDKVSHVGSDGKQHYYSSKPPLLATIVAGFYWPLHHILGLSFAEQPFLIGRTLIFTVNGLLLLILLRTCLAIIDRWSTTEWGRLYAAAVITWGTFLTTFAVTLNNHLPAATAVALVAWGLLNIRYEGRREWWIFALIGSASAMAAANDLPCLSLVAAAGLGCLIVSFRQTLLGFVPGLLLVVAAFFATNKIAHDSWRPPYAHRAAGQDWQGDNWYNYPGTYWNEEGRQGVDRGELSIVKYAFHTSLGHHGVLSLTPVWLLCFGGVWLLAKKESRPEMALLIAALTSVCWLFYINRPLVDRNYAGLCCGFRWMFWLIPLWLVALIPLADSIAANRKWRRVAWILFTISLVSALYGSFHPWVHPWPYALLLYFQ
jgi:hypothetical protein